MPSGHLGAKMQFPQENRIWILRSRKNKQGVPLRRADRPAGTRTAQAGERGAFEGTTTPYGVAPSRTTLLGSLSCNPIAL